MQPPRRNLLISTPTLHVCQELWRIQAVLCQLKLNFFDISQQIRYQQLSCLGEFFWKLPGWIQDAASDEE
ncbi:hypothetical protein T07_1363 [Trichinella nelsoni]|uniref:Uncharacterized protein n=1 Tax=Trichinella nelsoni TaxID=6336 RepID=A0A0V0REU7_9BILA|nr:hypothetical protein T07_1363 [Trichinella nelsoni]